MNKNIAIGLLILGIFPGPFNAAIAGEPALIQPGHGVLIEAERSRVLEVIQFSLGFYIDELIDLDSERVHFRQPVDTQFEHLNEIVKHTLSLYDHPAMHSFWGFSATLEKQLMRINDLDGYWIDRVNKDAPAHNQAVGQYTLKIQLGNLKRAAQNEAEEFIADDPSSISISGQLLTEEHLSGEDRVLRAISRASQQDIALLIDSLFELDEVPLGLIDRINARIETLEDPTDGFVKNQPLDPILHDIETFEEPDDVLLSLNIEEADPDGNPPSNAPVDFNTRVLELLEDNNRLMAKYSDRFDYMQEQINELKEAQLTASLEREKRLQDQIDELYAMMKQVGQSGVGGSATASTTALKPVEIIFERNAHNIGIIDQTKLNEVLAGMTRNPKYKLMITGFADRTGNREYNALLSQKRAQAVYDYLRQGGIAAERMVVNYLGDNKSDAPNPLDRKVEVEWLTNF